MSRGSIDKQAVADFFTFCDENEVEFIDFRFTKVYGII